MLLEWNHSLNPKSFNIKKSNQSQWDSIHEPQDYLAGQFSNYYTSKSKQEWLQMDLIFYKDLNFMISDSMSDFILTILIEFSIIVIYFIYYKIFMTKKNSEVKL